MADEKEIKINIDNAEEERPEKKEEAREVENNTSAETGSPTDTDTIAKTETAEEITGEEKLKIRVADLEDKLLRTMADFDNYKKRTVRQFDDIITAANDKLIVDFLEIADNFERALTHDHDTIDLKTFRKGVELIFNQMNDFLKRHDVKPIKAVGHPFDPNRHEAVMQIESDKYDEGVVAMEINKGYLHGNRVLRYSKVAVSSGKKKEKEE